jgi:hypothetical protein
VTVEPRERDLADEHRPQRDPLLEPVAVPAAVARRGPAAEALRDPRRSDRSSPHPIRSVLSPLFRRSTRGADAVPGWHWGGRDGGRRPTFGSPPTALHSRRRGGTRTSSFGLIRRFWRDGTYVTSLMKKPSARVGSGSRAPLVRDGVYWVHPSQSLRRREACYHRSRKGLSTGLPSRPPSTRCRRPILPSHSPVVIVNDGRAGSFFYVCVDDQGCLKSQSSFTAMRRLATGERGRIPLAMRLTGAGAPTCRALDTLRWSGWPRRPLPASGARRC